MSEENVEKLQLLSLRQADMLARQARSVAKRRRRDPAEKVALLEFRTKIAAFTLLMQKWSVARVAARLQVNIHALRSWIQAGCPLLDPSENQLTENQELLKQASNNDDQR